MPVSVPEFLIPPCTRTHLGHWIRPTCRADISWILGIDFQVPKGDLKAIGDWCEPPSKLQSPFSACGWNNYFYSPKTPKSSSIQSDDWVIDPIVNNAIVRTLWVKQKTQTIQAFSTIRTSNEMANSQNSGGRDLHFHHFNVDSLEFSPTQEGQAVEENIKYAHASFAGIDYLEMTPFGLM